VHTSPAERGPSKVIRIQWLTKSFISLSLCKSLIRKLLIKDENRRLGARAGASDIKGHPFFRTTQWALIRHMKPPIVPNQGRDIDTVNFRNVKESESVDISGSKPMALKGVPLDSGLATPGGDAPDPFEEFNSVTLHHDGEDYGANGYES
jgi:protein-serine/threonine kinase